MPPSSWCRRPPGSTLVPRRCSIARAMRLPGEPPFVLLHLRAVTASHCTAQMRWFFLPRTVTPFTSALVKASPVCEASTRAASTVQLEPCQFRGRGGGSAYRAPPPIDATGTGSTDQPDPRADPMFLFSSHDVPMLSPANRDNVSLVSKQNLRCFFSANDCAWLISYPTVFKPKWRESKRSRTR